MHVVNRLVLAGLENMVTSLMLHMREFEQMVSVEVKFTVPTASSENLLESRNISVFHMNRSESRPQRMLPFKYMSLFRRERVDILHTHSGVWRDAFLGGKMAGVPIHFHTEHGVPVNGSGRKERLTYRILSGLSTQLISVSDDLNEQLISEFQLNPKKLRVICNGIDLNKYAPLSNSERLRTELGIAPGERIIGTVGRIVPLKDHKTLVRAFALVLEQVPRCRLMIVGREETSREGVMEEILELADELGVREKVLFTGERKDVPELLNLMDVFALSSLTEGTSMAILEASATETPVVATKVGGNPKIVKDGKTGFLAPPKNPEIFARKLVEVLKDQNLAEAMGTAGREMVKTQFSIQKMASQYHQLYSSFLEENP
jgi:sugar transferase (PEP-CTERM/EpsH1 system associated)